MKRFVAGLVFTSVVCFFGCARKEEAVPAKQDAAVTPSPVPGPHVSIHLQNGSKIPGAIVASTQTDMVVAGDDGIERKIPLTQVKSVDYGASTPKQTATVPASPQPTTVAPVTPSVPITPVAPAAPTGGSAPVASAPVPTPALPPAEPPQPVVRTKTFKLPVGSEVSVRTNEPIDSATANEGQTFDAQVTRDARDAAGDIVIPRGSPARIVIRSASKGGRFHGAADLVLDLDSVVIDGRSYTISTVDMAQKGADGVGANKRTAEYSGGGAALGAIIGAIAGGGKAAAIGAGAGAGGGALTQILTKGGSIKVPVESVLTFSLDKALRVAATQ